MASSRVLPYPDPRNRIHVPMEPAHSFHFSTDLAKETDKGVFSSLAESVRDFFFPPKMAPLQLSSAPVYLRDPMAGQRNPRATMMAVVINSGIVFTLIWVGAHQITPVAAATPIRVVDIVAPVTLPKAPPKIVTMAGGGGHTTPMPKPIAHGNPPKLDIQKPPIIVTDPPKIHANLAVEPTVQVQNMQMAKVNTPNLGMANAPVAAVSAGSGAGAGMGAGLGNGLGAGSGGNFGGGVFKVGGGVTEPQVLFAPDPQFTEEARQAKAHGKVVVYLQVNPEGRPMHARIVKGLGMGLDEKALEAVRQYKFKPALKDGHPVTVEMNVEVNFQIL